jgi:hypothetical protein
MIKPLTKARLEVNKHQMGRLKTGPFRYAGILFKASTNH